jgi:hypothetical protein
MSKKENKMHILLVVVYFSLGITYLRVAILSRRRGHHEFCSCYSAAAALHAFCAAYYLFGG